MNRPAVLRQLEARAEGKAVTPFRLRAHDVEALVAYVQHLELDIPAKANGAERPA